jgi:hypothetical protein
LIQGINEFVTAIRGLQAKYPLLANKIAIGRKHIVVEQARLITGTNHLYMIMVG